MAQQLYGKFRGEVIDIEDPEARGRIRVKCPNVLQGTTLNWAQPCIPPSYFSMPRVGDLVWIEFEQGFVDEPIWTGCFYTTAQWAQRAGEFDNTLTYINSTGKLGLNTTEIYSNQKFPEANHADLASDIG